MMEEKRIGNHNGDYYTMDETMDSLYVATLKDSQLMQKHGFTIAKDVAEIIQNVCVEDDIRQYEALPQLNAVVI